MGWFELVDDHRFLQILFPSAEPSLDAIRVHEIVLHQDGPRLQIRFDLNEFPSDPPKKWIGLNQIQVRLMFIGIRKIEIEGWSTNNIGAIRLLRTARDGISLDFSSNESKLRGEFDFLRLDQVSAHQKSRSP